jgi:hypothetical protein
MYQFLILASRVNFQIIFIIFVDGGSLHPFNTIQEAILNATNGDTVFVNSGTYAEHINFEGKGIVVVAQSGATTIDGRGTTNCVTFNKNEVCLLCLRLIFKRENAVLSGFTIINCIGSEGAAIYIENSSPTIRNCVIRNNTATLSGGGDIIFFNFTNILRNLFSQLYFLYK